MQIQIDEREGLPARGNYLFKLKYICHLVKLSRKIKEPKHTQEKTNRPVIFLRDLFWRKICFKYTIGSLLSSESYGEPDMQAKYMQIANQDSSKNKEIEDIYSQQDTDL